MESRDTREALAFCVIAKLHFVNSLIQDANVRRLKAMFRIGSDRLARILRTCEELGLVERRPDGSLFFNKLPNGEANGYKYVFKISYEKREKENSDNIVLSLKLNQGVDMLRKAATENYIRTLESIRKNIEVTKAPTNATALKRAKKRCRGLLCNDCQFNVSNRRLSSVAKCSVSKLRQLKREMIGEKQIERGFCNTRICALDKMNISAYRKYVEDKFVFLGHDGNIYRHEANIYSYVGDRIFLHKNNKK